MNEREAERGSHDDALRARREFLLRKLARVERKIDRNEERLAEIERCMKFLKQKRRGAE
jgi:hypothetical protein